MDILVHAWQWLQATVGAIWIWVMQLPWGQWVASLLAMTIVEWVGFLASIAALIAFVIGGFRVCGVFNIQSGTAYL
jgi:hypothetical protein